MTLVEQQRRQFDIGDVQLDDGTFIGDIQTVDECERAMTELSLRISAIQGQIDNAKGLAMESGMYSDRIWWRKVNSALKINKAARQHLQDMRGKLRREHTQIVKKDRDERLIAALRAYVGEQAFLRIAATVE